MTTVVIWGGGFKVRSTAIQKLAGRALEETFQEHYICTSQICCTGKPWDSHC